MCAVCWLGSIEPSTAWSPDQLRNVLKADISLFDRFLSHLYYLEVVEVCPSQLGWPCARPRQYCRMRHKAKAGATCQDNQGHLTLKLSIAMMSFSCCNISSRNMDSRTTNTELLHAASCSDSNPVRFSLRLWLWPPFLSQRGRCL